MKGATKRIRRAPEWARFVVLLALSAMLAFGLVALLTREGASDAETQPVVNTGQAGGARPVLLMFHAGGFLEGSPELLERLAVPVARRQGFEPVNVEYPLGDPEAALRTAQDAARSRAEDRRLCAYGESAGGMLAVRLAQGNFGVGAVATYSPLVDLTTFLDGFFAASTQAQVIGRDSKVPILAMSAGADEADFRRDIRRWAHSDSEVRLDRIPGNHLGTEGEYEANVRRAMRWLARHCR